MKLIPAFLLLLISSFSFAQTKSDLVGKWLVEEVYFPDEVLPPEADHEKIKAFKAALAKASIVFNENGLCTLEIPYPQFPFTNGKWLYNAQTKRIDIRENTERGAPIVEIIINQKSNGETYFLLDETPVKLKVKKV